jgi:hypothetical protein
VHIIILLTTLPPVGGEGKEWGGMDQERGDGSEKGKRTKGGGENGSQGTSIPAERKG